ncbi:IS110 family transposase [Anaerosacchariphilus polymeriproducens]|uniref:IS110 family transposase n=1 Tax=Anaerosacchariphilus polymeriproducens TaxID=1812858 RepID=UPI0022876E70|nr:IS110 family transposase [Anaerosacchariphilus polymeriproducens]
MDVDKSKHDCCIIDSDGVIYTDSLRIPNSKDGFDILYNTIVSALSEADFSNVKIGLESTGQYSTNTTNFLYSKGFNIIVLNPLVTNAFRKAGTLRKTKTDKCDVKVIATMLFSDESKSYSPSSYQIQELKSLTIHRYRMNIILNLFLKCNCLHIHFYEDNDSCLICCTLFYLTEYY